MWRTLLKQKLPRPRFPITFAKQRFELLQHHILLYNGFSTGLRIAYD
jgi:hypothetical protein